jgi:hypothetical protein
LSCTMIHKLVPVNHHTKKSHCGGERKQKSKQEPKFIRLACFQKE